MEVLIIKSNEITAQQKLDWIRLHAECFSCNENKSTTIFNRKYLSNDSIFCMAYLNNQLSASYNIIICQSEKFKFALSTDTMSNGLIISATVKLANILYRHLKNLGFDFVVGFPNNKIQKIRERRLGWKIISEFKFYILPFFKSSKLVKPLFYINRSGGSFFALPHLITILVSPKGGGPNASCSSFFYLVGTCGMKPNFSFPLNNLINSSKNFGYVSLSGAQFPSEFYIDIDSIDVP